jgi:hypothetical protein
MYNQARLAVCRYSGSPRFGYHFEWADFRLLPGVDRLVDIRIFITSTVCFSLEKFRDDSCGSFE